jgi:hypothetical protein
LLSTATVILAGGFFCSPSADLISDAPDRQPVFSSLHREGLENLLAPAISYSFDQF